MTLAIGVSVGGGVRVPISRRRVTDIARRVLRSEGVRHALLSITFVTNPQMRALNRRHLQRRGDTDVIAFGFRPGAKGAPVIGDVYVAPAVARASARAHGITVREELTRLVVHGTLHVLGYDHPESERRTTSAMWLRQERVVRRLMRSAR